MTVVLLGFLWMRLSCEEAPGRRAAYMEGGHSVASLHHYEEDNPIVTEEIAGGVVSNSFVAPAAPVAPNGLGFAYAVAHLKVICPF